MDIISTFNPPRFITIAKQDFWIRGLTLGDFALVIAWLDDILPGHADRTLPPRFLGKEAQAALETPFGRCVLAWAAMRHSGLTWNQCQSLALNAQPEQWSRLLTILFRRRKNIRQSLEAEDLGEGWWGPMVAGFCTELSYRPQDLESLSLDQLDCLVKRGLEDEKPGILTVEEVQAMWEAAKKSNGR